jgi:hypothetical protein
MMITIFGLVLSRNIFYGIQKLTNLLVSLKEDIQDHRALIIVQ